MSTSVPASPPHGVITRSHLKRLKLYYRSAGWPARDNLEIDLVVAGLAERRIDPNGYGRIYVVARAPKVEKQGAAIELSYPKLVRRPALSAGAFRRT